MLMILLLGEPAFAGQANVFIYHRFNDSRYPSTNISLEDFSAHLEILRQQQFAVLKLGEVVESLQRGNDLPQRCAVISIDDAYHSFLDFAWPLLKRYGYPATLFVSTDSVGGADYLDWQELRALQGEGLEIGNHSAAHAFLLDRKATADDAEWSQRATEDIERSQQAFVKQLGSAPRLFAYPYGEFDAKLASLVRKAGFEAAFGQQSGVVAAGQDLFRLPRFPMGGSYASADEFRSKLFMKPLPVQVVAPESTLITDKNPPKLVFYLNREGLDTRSLRCFVPGQPDCQVRPVGDKEGLYEVVAAHAITGRRSKYTVTASDRQGRTWYWFSQLWVRPD